MNEAAVDVRISAAANLSASSSDEGAPPAKGGRGDELDLWPLAHFIRENREIYNCFM